MAVLLNPGGGDGGMQNQRFRSSAPGRRDDNLYSTVVLRQFYRRIIVDDGLHNAFILPSGGTVDTWPCGRTLLLPSYLPVRILGRLSCNRRAR